MITISLPPSDAEEDDEDHDPLSVGPGGRCDECGELVDDGMKCTARCPDQICRQKFGSRLRSAVCALKLTCCVEDCGSEKKEFRRKSGRFQLPKQLPLVRVFIYIKHGT